MVEPHQYVVSFACVNTTYHSDALYRLTRLAEPAVSSCSLSSTRYLAFGMTRRPARISARRETRVDERVLVCRGCRQLEDGRLSYHAGEVFPERQCVSSSPRTTLELPECRSRRDMRSEWWSLVALGDVLIQSSPTADGGEPNSEYHQLV